MTHAAQHPSSMHRESRFRVRCPHCDSFARARSSKQLTTIYREVRFECTNDACGHVWLAGLETLRTLCPSEQPNPEIHIPHAVAVPVMSAEPAAPVAAAG
ncbi:MAG TPA: ogr/Delta-like zinc finger family protein [Rhodanobacter sp.]|jgi:hypothetical protein|nr:ogr/Delta-like zinc finger family protein [Rhodanobacter sp.]